MGTIAETSDSVQTREKRNKGYFEHNGNSDLTQYEIRSPANPPYYKHSKESDRKDCCCQSKVHWSSQYYFRASSYVWSSGLYCSIQEDLNLKRWRFFDTCKRIWEKADENSRKSSSKSVRLATSISKADDGRDHKGDSEEHIKLSSMQTSAKLPKNTVPSQNFSLVYEDPVSDFSMSLEPISSSSFHSSSDCEGDNFS